MIPRVCCSFAITRSGFSVCLPAFKSQPHEQILAFVKVMIANEGVLFSADFYRLWQWLQSKSILWWLWIFKLVWFRVKGVCVLLVSVNSAFLLWWIFWGLSADGTSSPVPLVYLCSNDYSRWHQPTAVVYYQLGTDQDTDALRERYLTTLILSSCSNCIIKRDPYCTLKPCDKIFSHRILLYQLYHKNKNSTVYKSYVKKLPRWIFKEDTWVIYYDIIFEQILYFCIIIRVSSGSTREWLICI